MPHCMKPSGIYYYWTGSVTESWRDANGKQRKRPVFADGRNVQEDHERFIRVSQEQERLQADGVKHDLARLLAIKNVCSNQNSKQLSTKPGVVSTT